MFARGLIFLIAIDRFFCFGFGVLIAVADLHYFPQGSGMARSRMKRFFFLDFFWRELLLPSPSFINGHARGIAMKT